jgi:hypothetical protein
LSHRAFERSAADAAATATARSRAVDRSGSRQTQWFVRTIMLLTTAFAFLDLYLLASRGHS